MVYCIICSCKKNKDCTCYLLLFKAIFDMLGEIGDLTGATFTLTEASLLRDEFLINRILHPVEQQPLKQFVPFLRVQRVIKNLKPFSNTRKKFEIMGRRRIASPERKRIRIEVQRKRRAVAKLARKPKAGYRHHFSRFGMFVHYFVRL